ncbi:MAG: CCA tRNA nucleotidyltransferase [Desulfobacterales bacterium]|nr:CCA tRNA nucleotidyltransferase [Desulfobacterales bacterium]
MSAHPFHPPLPHNFPAPLRRILAGMDGVFVVGGSLRDLAMGRPPTDVDITVTGDPYHAARQIARRIGGRPVRLGKDDRFIYRVAAGERIFDIAPVEGKDMASDLARRDFTVNAMAWDPRTDTLLDPHGGMTDLADRTIRMVSDSVFSADPLRMLRAFRLCATLEFALDARTGARIAIDAFRIEQSAGERISAELFKFFQAPRSAAALTGMDRCGLLRCVFPELAPLAACNQDPPHNGDVLAHTLAAYGHLENLLADGMGPVMTGKTAPPLEALDPERQGLLKCAILLHDIGKPAARTIEADGRIRFHGHGRIGAALAQKAARRLAFSNRQRRYIETVIAHHLRPLSLFLAHGRGQLTPKGMTRFFRACHPYVPDLLHHAVADMRAKATGEATGKAFADFARHLLYRELPAFSAQAARPPLISGHDLMEGLAMAPSPLLGRILDRVEEARLAGTIKTRDEALALAHNLSKP